MKKLKIKIENGVIKIRHDSYIVGIDMGNQQDSTCTVATKDTEPVTSFDNPTLEELSIIGKALKKSHDLEMNKLIAKEQESKPKSKTCLVRVDNEENGHKLQILIPSTSKDHYLHKLVYLNHKEIFSNVGFHPSTMGIVHKDALSEISTMKWNHPPGITDTIKLAPEWE